ncbi:hypothetical protein I0C86_41440 [Plantactinospora sp. S1510]|uniref:Uncharacterized protein n=1 Tax=Plantactinospora alkalitolerans TaxID=2789879 RepID=A0ABS0HA06_9ACTN|nr:hypothetical protein [Plantactinospora alkalitolerans]MBF9135317.1 hypothetical protein [Plantactinospora alkalitolerans]
MTQPAGDSTAAGTAGTTATGTDQTPAPAPAPVPTPPASTAPSPAAAPQQPAAPAAGGAPAPANPGAPWRELPVEDQVEYWRAQSRRHESRHLGALGLQPGELDQLRATAAEHQRQVEANQTEHERAVAAAEARGRTAALAEVGGQLVDAQMRVSIGDRMTDDQVTELLQNLDLRRFQTAAGGVDRDRVAAFVGTLLPQAAAPVTPAVPASPAGQPQVPATGAAPQAPAAVTGAPLRPAPDMGQGTHAATRPSGLAAGAEIARQRFGDRQAQPPATPQL